MSFTSGSWEALRPRINFECRGPADETPQQYVNRLVPEFNIPIEVAEQWLCAHYQNSETITNYAWLDYRRLKFIAVDMTEDVIANLYIIGKYRSFVELRASNTDYTEFTCSKIDVEFWKKESTWRVPPVVLDVASTADPPSDADITGPLQLIEGHSRFGNFLALRHAGKLRTRLHRVYLLCRKDGM